MLNLLPFQKQAVQTLQDRFFKSDKKNIVFYAPTGAGKTVMLIKWMDRILEYNPAVYDYAFVWISPGTGDLEEQSWNKAKSIATHVTPQNLDDVLHSSFEPETATFLNWERVKNDRALALRDGETKNLDDVIEEARQRSLHFVVIIDEEHRNQTAQAQKIISKFHADKIIRASATPTSNGADYDNVQVNDEDVIAQGLIVRNVELNPDGADGDVVSDMVSYFLDFADQKRKDIAVEYRKLGKPINPLVLIQFPDEKKAAKDFMAERGQLVNQVREYLTDGLGEQMANISTWLANEKVNVDDLANPESPVNWLLMKQAVSTGWDAPRAKILVKLRINTEENFTLQTIGRIRRMPEQKHYDNDLLDNAFIYSNDERYIAEVLDTGEGVKIASYKLRDSVPDFCLTSVKPNAHAGLSNPEVVKAYYQQFKEDYDLSDTFGRNQEILQQYGFEFGNLIYQNLGQTDDLARDMVSENIATYRVEVPVDVRKNRLDLLNSEQKIQKFLYREAPADVAFVLKELFSNSSTRETVKKFLNLKPAEFMAFVINNYRLLRDVAKKAEAAGKFNKQLSLEFGLALNKLDSVKFETPKIEMYQVKEGSGKVFEKNIYEGYSENNLVRSSKPERLFDTWLEQSDKVKYWYKSKDRGEKYFSVAYGMKKEGFFPDYLVIGFDGLTYIIETKGGQGQNIDEMSEMKFKAIREWSESSKTNPNKAKFAFVRPLQNANGESTLVFNNSQWDDNLNNRDVWKPIIDLFGNEQQLF